MLMLNVNAFINFLHLCVFLPLIVWGRRGGEDGPQTRGDVSGQHTKTLCTRKHGQHSFLKLQPPPPPPHTHIGWEQQQKISNPISRLCMLTMYAGKHDIDSMISSIYTVRQVAMILTSRTAILLNTGQIF